MLIGACGGSADAGDTGRAAGRYVGPAIVKPRYEYPRAAVADFVDACAVDAAQRPTCVCAIEWLQSTLPYRDYLAADRALRAQRPGPERARILLAQATEACRQ